MKILATKRETFYKALKRKRKFLSKKNILFTETAEKKHSLAKTQTERAVSMDLCSTGSEGNKYVSKLKRWSGFRGISVF